MASTVASRPEMDVDVSPRQKTPQSNPGIQSLGNINNGTLGSLDMRAEPDAQATVTDFLDFTEYLPADMMRSLTLIGDLDQTYSSASSSVHDLTTTWGQLPNLPADQRIAPLQLRADISENLSHAVNARIYSHAEAIRMAENINRHYVRAKTILTKLQTMLDNYPSPEEQKEQKSPVATAKSPQLTRAPKPASRGDGPRLRRPNLPRITVPGEVLAPYDLNYETYSDDDESSSESDDEEEDEADGGQSARVTPGPQPRIKLVKRGSKASKAPKTPKVRTSVPPPPLAPGISTSSALAQLQPPPENVVIGSADAPWGQLTQWELARLRKRMKKNAAWAPSDTMIARELKNLGRGVEAYNAAKQKAEEEGKPFEGTLPAPIVDPDTGAETLPPGALSKEALASEEKNLSNRGMKLNEAKKLKREQLAKLAAEEAEESARKMVEAARAMFDASTSQAGKQDQSAKTPSKTPKSAKKRKRDSIPEAEAAEVDRSDLTERSQKRTKTETPVPPPQLAPGSSQTSQAPQSQPSQQPQQPQPQPQPPQPPQQSQQPQPAQPSQTAQQPQQSHQHPHPQLTQATQSQQSQHPPHPPHLQQPQQSQQGQELPAQLSRTPAQASAVPLSTTPIPLPVHGQDQVAARMATSPAPSNSGNTLVSTVPLKPPAETPIPPPPHSPKKSTTPILPPTRETRKTQTGRKQEQPKEVVQPPQQLTVKPSSRAVTPAPLTPKPDPDLQSSSTVPAPPAPAVAGGRRPASRGKASSQEPQPSLAADRPRRASTARNTPAPERAEPTAARPTSKRAKRPAPGVISRTNSGGSSAVTKRKAAPKKKSARAAKKDKGGGSADATGGGEILEVEVDDEGNVIDPDEPRYCLCNRVSYGTMIQCDNVDNCKHEWFHLECIGLQEIPARTTKWYCPDCRILLNIGEKGEVNSRGVRA